jgi:hypothetical protein
MTEKDLEQVQLQVATTGLGLGKPALVCPHCHKPVRLLPGAKEKDASSKPPAWRAKAKS